MAFDSEGVFRPEVMEAFFDKFDTDGKGGLTFWEGFRGVRRVRMPWDLFGQGSAFFECELSFSPFTFRLGFDTVVIIDGNLVC